MRVFIFGLVLVAILCLCESRKHENRLENGVAASVSAPSANPFHPGRNYNKKDRLRGQHLFTDLYHKKRGKKGHRRKFPRQRQECKLTKCGPKQICIVHPKGGEEKCINKHDLREGRRLFRQFHKQRKVIKNESQIKALEAELLKGEHMKDIFDLYNHHIQARRQHKRGRKHHKHGSNIERKQDALFKEAMEDQQCRATELEKLKTRMIGWFDMIHTESREEKHRSHHSHFDQLSMFHNKKGHNLGKPELGHRDRSVSHHDKQSMYHRKRDRKAPDAFSAEGKGDHLDKQSMYHRKRDGIADAKEGGHLDQQSMFHAKRDKTARVPVAFGPQTADHVDQQSMYHRKRGKVPVSHRDKQNMYHHKRGRSKRSVYDIVEKESHGGCTCSKSVMWEFRKQDTSGDGHLTEDELSVMSVNRREPCMKHLLKSCDTHNKHDKYLKLARGEWCCCFQEIVAPCFEKKKHSNPDEWIPSCDDEGYFEREQRHKDGSSWCVDINGNMIEGTKTKQGNADCKNFGPSGYPIKP